MWGGGERLLLEVLCDQRLILAIALVLVLGVLEPSQKATMPSAAPLAALERRRAAGGGVSGPWDSLGSLRESEADRWTVTTDEEEREALRDDWRRWAAAATSAG